MTAYTPGLYRTAGGKVYHYNGSSWNPFSKDFTSFDEEYETWSQPEDEMIPLTGDNAKILQVKAWWSKVAKTEGVDWNAMVDLGEILMGE